MKRPEQAAVGAETLTRGLALLRLIAGQGPTTLHDAHKQMGVSKPTVLRALQALEAQQFLTRRLTDGAYVVNPAACRLLSPTDISFALAGAASPILRELAARLAWPVDVAVCGGAGIVVVDSNRRLLKWPFTVRVIGHRPPLLSSAMGRVYLAYCSDTERQHLLRTAHAAAENRVRRLLDQRILDTEADQVRKRGYARRAAGHLTIDAENRDEHEAIAVPILRNGRILGCMNCVWSVSTLSLDRFVDAHLAALSVAADNISMSLNNW